MAPGTRVGQYEIVQLVGRGGMGEVYEARHARLGKRVAVKMLHARLARSSEMTQRFLREGAVTCQVGHPNIVDITDTGVHRRVPYLVMEFLEGRSLEEQIYEGPRLAVAQLVDLMLPVVAALAAAHDHGVIHRDIKPANIILARDRVGRVVPKVVDFGISRLAGGVDLTRVSLVPGTPCYMAPELAKESRGDARSDQFALGVTLYEALHRKRPNRGRDRGREELPPALEQLVSRAMEHDPRHRFPGLRELGAALLSFASRPVRITWSPTFLSMGDITDQQTVLRPSSAIRTPHTPHRTGPGPQHRPLSYFLTSMLLLLSAALGILVVLAWDICTSPDARPVVENHASRAKGVGLEAAPTVAPLAGQIAKETRPQPVATPLNWDR